MSSIAMRVAIRLWWRIAEDEVGDFDNSSHSRVQSPAFVQRRHQLFNTCDKKAAVRLITITCDLCHRVASAEVYRQAVGRLKCLK